MRVSLGLFGPVLTRGSRGEIRFFGVHFVAVKIDCRFDNHTLSILTGAFSTRHVSPAILQHRIFELTQERDAARRECQSLREQLAKAASETAIAKPIGATGSPSGC
jgi:hypothetical protein